jgi:hypothetical protein
MKTFHSPTVIPKLRIDLYENYSNRVPYICHNFEKSKTGSSRIKDPKRERGVYLFFFYFLLFMENTGVWWLVLVLASGAMKNQ